MDFLGKNCGRLFPNSHRDDFQGNDEIHTNIPPSDGAHGYLCGIPSLRNSFPVEFLPCGIQGQDVKDFFPGNPNLFWGETKFPFLSFRDILILHLLAVRKDEDPPANEWIGNSVIHSRDPSKSLGSTDP